MGHYYYRYQGARRYNVNVLPTLVIINQEGQIAHYFQGTLSEGLLKAYIKQTKQAFLLPKPGIFSPAHAFLQKG